MTLFFKGCSGQAHEILSKLISLGGIANERLMIYGCIDAGKYYFIGSDHSIVSVSAYSIAAYNTGSRLFINNFDNFKKVCPYNVGDFVKIKRNFLDIKYEITKVVVDNLDKIYYYLDEDDKVAWAAEDLEKD